MRCARSSRLGLTARLNGDGIVVEQTPAAGAPIEPATTSCSRSAVEPVATGQRTAMTVRELLQASLRALAARARVPDDAGRRARSTCRAPASLRLAAGDAGSVFVALRG